MSFSKLIEKFLEVNFEIVIDQNVMVRDKVSGDLVESYSMIKRVALYFTNTVIDEEERTPITIFGNWFKREERRLTLPMLEYLQQCNVRLGRTNWETYSINEELVTEHLLFKLLGGKVGLKYIKKYFDDWQEGQVYVESERIMNRY